jgi:hypothetical protein
METKVLINGELEIVVIVLVDVMRLKLLQVVGRRRTIVANE